jgi:hypothetical protein
MHFSFPNRIFSVLLLANLVAASSKSSSSKKSESQDLSTSPQSPNNKKKKSHGHITHRMTREARTTLLGVEMEDLTAAETIFFEDTWMTAYAQVHTNDDDDEIRAFVVQDHSQDRGRQLRGSSSPASDSRSLLFSWWKPPSYKYYYFDVFALFETSCGISCGDDRRKLEHHAETEEEFETVLCDLLRTGTMECFQEIDDCQVTYFEV